MAGNSAAGSDQAAGTSQITYLKRRPGCPGRRLDNLQQFGGTDLIASYKLTGKDKMAAHGRHHMRAYSPFNNSVEDRLIAALDCGRSLAREAAEWMQMRQQMQRLERNKLEELTSKAFRKGEVM